MKLHKTKHSFWKKISKFQSVLSFFALTSDSEQLKKKKIRLTPQIL